MKTLGNNKLRSPKRYSDTAKAFGLAELLVVLLILSVVALLSIPIRQGIRDRAKQVGCVNHLKGIYVALTLYAGDNRGYFPQAYLDHRWSNVLINEGYLVGKKASATPEKYMNFCPGTGGKPPGPRYEHIDNAYNYGINRDIVGWMNTPAPAPPVEPTPLAKINNPASKFLVLDFGNVFAGRIYAERASQALTPGDYTFFPGLAVNKNRSWKPEAESDAINGRHGRTINVVFVDGHVETYAPEEVVLKLDNWEP